MIKVQLVASYICKRYMDTFHQAIDEMKLHKLLYFTQREALVQTGEPMFAEQFMAWKYGPVMQLIRPLYKNGLLTNMPSDDFINANKNVFDMVFTQYAPRDSWSLSMLSHDEYSWIKARNGCGVDDYCDTLIQLEDIREDAKRIKLQRALYRNNVTTV